jgi:rare lipoprotein A
MMRYARLLPFLALIAATLTVTGCAETQLAFHTAKQVRPWFTERPEPVYKLGDPYRIDGVWYRPAVNYDYVENGIASWYGSKFHQRRTANGEIFDMYRVSAAHRTLPLPSLVRVTNLENGRSIVVRVNDRGPFSRGRILDLSRRGADLLGFRRKGTAKVRVRILAEESRLLGDMARRGVSPAAQAAAIKSHQARGKTARLYNRGPSGGIETVAVKARPQPRGNSVETTARSEPPVVIEPVRPSQIYVQAGAFGLSRNARLVEQRLSSLGPTQITFVSTEGGDLYRVRCGPIATVEEADWLLDKVVASGYPDARIVVD